MKKQIPNLITLANLFCGVGACYYAAYNDFLSSSVYICLGIFLDFFDGLAARLLNVASPLGKELDSLADVVTSGVAPGLLLLGIMKIGCMWHPNPLIYCLPFIAMLIPLFSAYRLAKFNLDVRQSHSFIGLPVPANTLIWVGLALYLACNMYATGDYGEIIHRPWFLVALAVVSIITDILMISEIPMFSLKFDFHNMGWKQNSVQYIFFIGCAAIIIITRSWLAISIIILWYIILSILTRKCATTSEK